MLGLNSGLIGALRVKNGRTVQGMWTLNEHCFDKRYGNWLFPAGVYSQSSAFSGTAAASAAIMTDGLTNNTGSATNNNAGDNWIKIDYTELVYIRAVVIGTATSSIPGGWNKSYTENKNVQVSINDINWTTIFNTGSFAANGIYTFNIAPVNARYVRIVGSGFVAMTEFYAF